MGATGRNLFLWAFLLSTPPAIAGRFLNLPVVLFLCINLVSGIMVLYYYIYAWNARRKSRRMGLEHVVLLPLNYRWAEILIRMAGKKLKSKGRRAFEVHVRVPRNLTITEFAKIMDRELNLAKHLFPETLFIWETPVFIPASIRRFIREEEKKGNAFWEKGGWPIPRPPFVQPGLKKGTVRRGAILVRKES